MSDTSGPVLDQEQYQWYVDFLLARSTALRAMAEMGMTPAEMLGTLNLFDEQHVEHILKTTQIVQDLMKAVEARK